MPLVDLQTIKYCFSIYLRSLVQNSMKNY